MATVRNTITLQDRMTPVLRSMLVALNSTATALAAVDQVSDSSFSTMRRDIQSAQDALDDFNRGLDDIPPSARRANDGFTIWKGTLANILGNYLTRIPELMSRIVALSDQMSMSTAKLKLIGVAAEDLVAVQDKIFAAAQRATTPYMDMLELVTKLGQRAPELFSNMDESIRMAETLSKMFGIAGATQAEQHSATLQLLQALGSGVLRGEEFNAVFEAAPNIMREIADSMGIPIGQLREMASQGKITAEVVKNALMNASAEVDKEYAKLPMTWSHLATYAQNILLKAAQPLLDVLGAIAQFIFDNWATIEPILVGIAAALITVAVAMGITTLATAILDGTMKAFFITLLTNPIFWIALAVGVVIALFYKWAQSIGGLRNAWELFKMAVIVAWTAIQIAFFTGVNAVLTLFERLRIGWATASNAIVSYAGNMRVQVLSIIQNMVNSAINLINGFIAQLNRLPGVSIEAVRQVTFATTAKAENYAAQTARNNELSALKSEIATDQAARASNIQNLRTQLGKQTATLSSTYTQMKAVAANTSDMADYTGLAAAAAQNMAGNGVGVKGGSVDSVGKVEDVDSEDLKYLKDLAATQYINKYTTLQPEVNVTFGDVHETADANKLLKVIETMIEEAYATALTV